MEKEHAAPDSMATVNMKPEYAPSEVYSSASEPPPAYKMRASNSVQIARIVAVTVVLSSFILGSFVLASGYLAARSGCEQLQQLDAVLEKELMLEARHMGADGLLQDEPLPSAEHLQAAATSNQLGSKQGNKPLSDSHRVLQSLDGDTPAHPGPRGQHRDTDNSGNSEEDNNGENNENNNSESLGSNEQDDSYSPENNLDSEDEDGGSDEDRKTIQFKLPLQLDFDELAGALIEKNQRSRMNCIVEKRRAEEVVDQQPRSVRLPFGVNLTTDPKYQRVTGERMAIFCESGHETTRGNGNSDEQQPPQQVVHQQQMMQPIVVPIHLTAPQQMPMPQYHQMQQMPAQQMQAPVSPATRFFPIHMAPPSTAAINQHMMPPPMQQQQQQEEQQRQMRPPQIMMRPPQSQGQQQLPPAAFRGMPFDMRPPMMPQSMMMMGHQQHQQEGQQQREGQQEDGVPQIRVHVQRIAIPSELLRGMNPNEPPQVQHVPLSVGLQRIGMSQEAFRAIQEAAEAKFDRAARGEVSSASSQQQSDEEDEDNTSSSQEDDNNSSSSDEDNESTTGGQQQQRGQEPPMDIAAAIRHQMQLQQQQMQQQQQQMQHMEQQRRLMQAARIPVPIVQQQQQTEALQMLQMQQLRQQREMHPHPQLMMQMAAAANEQDSAESQRPHFVQPRSVRSVADEENPLLRRREKRVKRCACNCEC